VRDYRPSEYKFPNLFTYISCWQKTTAYCNQTNRTKKKKGNKTKQESKRN